MYKSNIYINQVGYLLDEDKYFLTTEKSEYFNIVDSNAQNWFCGKVKLECKKDKASGDTLYKGNFSEFNKKGDYYIVLDNGNKSPVFTIGEGIYNNVLYKSLRSFYFQRCGSSLKEEIVGEFKRVKCHTGSTKYHPSTGLEGEKDVSGGWHDAGDYGKYITPASVALGIMMVGFENFPEKFSFNHLGLADNKAFSDFLGEIRYELDWMLKMQEIDKNSNMYGAVHYMVNSKKYNWVTPEKDNDEQYILGYCSRATADFAAVMALASRVFKGVDIEFSEMVLERSKIAWEFLSKNRAYPKKGFQRPDDMITGGYSEYAKDNQFRKSDMLWPAVELFLTTGDKKYNKVAKKVYKNGFRIKGGMDWMDKTGFPEVQYSMSNVPWIDTKFQGKVRKNFLKKCNRYLNNSLKDGFSVSLKKKEYKWGSNGEILTRSLKLILAYTLLGETKYKKAALKQLDYILGLNTNSISFVVGLGSNYPQNIHHSSLANDKIKKCFPGIMAGGANRKVKSDKALESNFKNGTPSAKCYIDDTGSYSSNENCITYSAPLIPVTAFFSSIT